MLDMGDFAGGLLKYLRRRPLPRLTIGGGFGKLSKLAMGHMDLHSGRSQVIWRNWLRGRGTSVAHRLSRAGWKPPIRHTRSCGSRTKPACPWPPEWRRKLGPGRFRCWTARRRSRSSSSIGRVDRRADRKGFETQVLILGGSGEAADLARRLAPRTEFDVVTSLAGRTHRPAAVPGRVRTGGFGGVEGLSACLDAEGVDAVVDATHPYAANISRHAAQACDALGIPRVQLWRPAWPAVEGDRWTEAASPDAAAEAVANTPVSQTACVFLSTGARDLPVFSHLRAIRFLVRLVDAPRTPLPLARAELIVGRGPFALGSERTLFLEHGVELLVSRNSGGGATYPKLVAARELPDSGDHDQAARSGGRPPGRDRGTGVSLADRERVAKAAWEARSGDSRPGRAVRVSREVWSGDSGLGGGQPALRGKPGRVIRGPGGV